MLQDVRIAVRGYLAKPLFTIVVLSILGLAIGANSAIFTVVNAVLLRPLDYPAGVGAGQRLAARSRRRSAAGRSRRRTTSISRSRRRSFAGIAAYWSPTRQPVRRRQRSGEGAGGDLHLRSLQRARRGPSIGRALTADDDVARREARGGARLRLWKRRFGGDPAAVGRETMLDGAPTLIVGVMPPAFDFPVAGTELWVPLRLSRTQPPNPRDPPARYRQYRILSVVARLKPDVTVEQARLEMSSIASAARARLPGRQPQRAPRGRAAAGHRRRRDASRRC